jgi:hypothetical protein
MIPELPFAKIEIVWLDSIVQVAGAILLLI